jgi:ribonuclease P protein component
MEGDESRRVAYAVPRKVGTAVERNRCRRRLRAVAVDATSEIPAGSYLVGVETRVCNLPYQELRARVIEAIHAATKAGAK